MLVVRFWISHALTPLVVFISLVFIFHFTDFDLFVSNFFYDFELNLWYFGESWWAKTFIHEWGRDLVAIIFLLSLVSLISCLLFKKIRRNWFFFAYIVLVILFSTGIVAAIKHFTNIDCPWDLSLYNGSQPYYNIFSNYAGEAINGRCFPGGHSSGGFSLLLFYFLLRDINRRYAYIALGMAILIGSVFSLGQWVRGAHFVSHDMWSAMICWFIALLLYKLFYQARVKFIYS